MIFQPIDISMFETYMSKYPNGKTIFESLAETITFFNAAVIETNAAIASGILTVNEAEDTLREELTAIFDNLEAEYLQDFAVLQDQVDAAVLTITDKVSQAQLTAISAQLAETDQRIDNIVTTPVPVGEIIAQEIIDARQGALSVGANITEVKSQLASIYDHIFTPSGLLNDSQRINDLIASGGNFLIKKGIYNITDNINVKSNTYIKFEPGAIFKKTATDKDTYYVINVFECDNVIIETPQIEGDRDIHIGTTGEWGHGINITNSDNVRILHPKVEKCWGDGIYIGLEYHSTSLKETGFVEIVKPEISRSRRNGISVCSGRRIIIDNPYTEYVDGTAPKAGIDIEPESSGKGLRPYLDEVIINNHHSKGCGRHLLIFLENLKDRGLKTNIEINGGNGEEGSVLIAELRGVLGGKLRIKDLLLSNAPNFGFTLRGYKAENTPHIYVDNLVINEFNTSNNQSDYDSNGIQIMTYPSAVDSNYDVGNITFTNPTVISKNNVNYGRSMYLKNFLTVYSLKNVNIVNPLAMVNGNDRLNVLDGGIKVSDSNGVYKKDLSYYQEYLNWNNFCKRLTNKNATSLITVFLEGGFVDETEVTFEVKAPQVFRLKPSTTSSILPLGIAGKYMQSNVVGSTITLRKSGVNWFIVNQIGTWTFEA